MTASAAPCPSSALTTIAPGPGRLSVGLELPLDNDWTRGDGTGEGRRPGEPDLGAHRERARLADRYGFRALWLRDVPLYDPSFGDAGQVFEPFTYLGYLAAATHDIVLGTAAIALPLRHPLHVAKMVASVHRLSGRRFVLGIASGDRHREFPAFDVDEGARRDLVRSHLRRARAALTGPLDPISGLEVLPRPATGETVPVISAGRAGQDIPWLAEHLDGHMTYHRAAPEMSGVAHEWHATVGDSVFKPLLTTMLLDLRPDPDDPPRLMRFGASLGRNSLVAYLRALEDVGVNHVAINLRPNRRPVEETMDEIATHVLPRFGVREAVTLST